MTIDMILLGAIIAVAAILFALDVYPVDKISIIVLSSLVITRLISPSEAVAGFGNSATITVACMLALSYGVQTTGGLSYVANKIIDIAGTSQLKLFLAIVLAVGFLSAFTNNTAAVALFLPLTIAVAREQHLDPGQFLMPMSFAAIFAGTCTLIGTSTNLLVYAMAKEHLDWEIGMFEFSKLGLILSGVGLIYLLCLGRRLLSRSRSVESLTEEYHLRNFVTELVILDGSLLIGKSLAESEFREKYNLEVIEILRKGRKILLAASLTKLQLADILLVQGPPNALIDLQKAEGVKLKALTVEDHDLEDENILLVEAFISPVSKLVDRTLKEINFRRTFKANALAIRSHGRTIREKIGKIRLEYGDSLLILTSRDQVDVLRHNQDFLVMEEVRITSLHKDKIYYATCIFLGIVLLATFGVLSILEAALVGVALMLLTGCLRLNVLYNEFPWQTIIMLACLIPLGTAMEKVGLASIVATEVVGVLQSWGPWVILYGIYFLTAILTAIMSNNATVILMFPIALSVAAQIQVDPKPFVIAVMFAASTCFMTPVGYQTNLFVFGPGGYRFIDFLKVGGPLSFIFWMIAPFLIPFFWKF